MFTVYPQFKIWVIFVELILLIASYLEWIKYADNSIAQLKMLKIKASYIHRYYYWCKFVDGRQLILPKSHEIDLQVWLVF